jgi:hypothetical protein
MYLGDFLLLLLLGGATGFTTATRDTVDYEHTGAALLVQTANEMLNMAAYPKPLRFTGLPICYLECIADKNHQGGVHIQSVTDAEFCWPGKTSSTNEWLRGYVMPCVRDKCIKCDDCATKAQIWLQATCGSLAGMAPVAME